MRSIHVQPRAAELLAGVRDDAALTPPVSAPSGPRQGDADAREPLHAHADSGNAKAHAAPLGLSPKPTLLTSTTSQNKLLPKPLAPDGKARSTAEKIRPPMRSAGAGVGATATSRAWAMHELAHDPLGIPHLPDVEADVVRTTMFGEGKGMLFTILSADPLWYFFFFLSEAKFRCVLRLADG